MLLLDNQSLDLNNLQTPILINGADKSGASFFSVELIADLFRVGNKVLFFSGYEMAKTSFISNVGESSVVFVDSFISTASSSRAIILEDKNEQLLLEYLSNLPDIAERVLYIKNFDLYSVSTILRLNAFNKLVLMGDLDKAVPECLQINFNTKIYFTYPIDLASDTVPHLEKYKGYLQSSQMNGIVSVE